MTEIRVVVKINEPGLVRYAAKIEADMRADGIELEGDTALELMQGWSEELRDVAALPMRSDVVERVDVEVVR